MSKRGAGYKSECRAAAPCAFSGKAGEQVGDRITALYLIDFAPTRDFATYKAVTYPCKSARVSHCVHLEVLFK